MRRVLEDPSVLESTGLALICICDEVVRLPVARTRRPPICAPLGTRAAAPLQPRGRDRVGNFLRSAVAQSILERRVAAACAVFSEAMRGRGHRKIHQQRLAGHGYCSSSSRRSSAATSEILDVALVDHHHRRRAAGAEALGRVEREAAVGVVSPGAISQLVSQVFDQAFGASHRAADIAANSQVPTADRPAAKLRIERQRLPRSGSAARRGMQPVRRCPRPRHSRAAPGCAAGMAGRARIRSPAGSAPATPRIRRELFTGRTRRRSC